VTEATLERIREVIHVSFFARGVPPKLESINETLRETFVDDQ
jgi:coenzyme F420-reducing hydrogenase gamma subunit